MCLIQRVLGSLFKLFMGFSRQECWSVLPFPSPADHVLWFGEDSWESLDCKEIKPVNPKGNKSWIFIRRTDAKAEAPVLWPPDAKSQLIRKDPDAGKIKGRKFSSVQPLSHVQLFATPWIAARLPPWPSPTPRVYPNPCPLSWRCHPAISSSVIPFSSCPQSFPALGSFPMSQLFSWGGQSIGVSASTSVLPMNTQDWSPLGWTGWISLQSRDSRESSPTPQSKSINSLALSFLHCTTLTSIHDYWKNHSLD